VTPLPTEHCFLRTRSFSRPWKDSGETISKAQIKSTGSIVVLIAAVLIAGVAVWPSTITRIASYSFLPHGFCYLWNKQLLTLHVVSDSLIFLSYLAIAVTITWLLYRERRRIPFGGIFVAFGVFILACGFTHAMDIVVLWIPLYWLAGDVKFVTAIASVTTAIALPLLVPKIRRILKDSASSRQNELKFLGAAETSLDGLYLADAVRNAKGEVEDFAFTYVNDNAVLLVASSREKLIGGRMCELFPINRKIGLFDRYKEVVRTGESFVGEFSIDDEQIKATWVRIQAAKLGDGVAVTASNISERKQQEEELRVAYERLALATESGEIGLWEWDIANGITTWDPLTYRLFGLEPSSIPGDYDMWKERLHPDDAPATEAAIWGSVERSEPYNHDYRAVWPDGEIRHIHATGLVKQDETGRTLRLVGANWDVSAQKENEFKLARIAAFMRSIIASSPFATIVMDLHGVITSFNPAAERMLWYRKEDLIDLETPLVLLNSQELAERAQNLSEELQVFIQAGIDVLTANPLQGRVEEAQWKLLRRDGSSFDAQLTVSALTNDLDEVTGFILIAYDITERKRAQEYITHVAHHDALTGLPTRILFRDRLEAALARARRYHRKIGTLMVDLDNFKKVNDQMGHHVGDELLIVIAKRLQSCVRASDTVARMGGDEFTIILDELRNLEDAELVAEKIVQEIALPVSIGSHTLFPTASVGISVYPETGQTVEALLTNADAAMYRAKAEGRNGRQTYTRELESTASRRRQLEDGLSHALALKEFELVYQPQICMKTGLVSGVEALLRWRSGKLGTVMPDEFISLAEENGMIVPIGEWVLRTACRQAQQLQQELDRSLTVAVNISPRQFQQNNLPHMIGRILAESNLKPSSLELEITEGLLIGESPRPQALLEEIRSLGVHVAIDDFGTGFSSMSYILRFRVDRLKIDQSFIHKMDVNADSYAVTHAVIALAKALHIPVVAEGVETAAQRDLLLAENCDEAQGYLYSRPIPIEGLSSVIYVIEH
jgi:diguanylate cyclase (GGDEF)-like protein/PAS domain S-box-containing protein